MVSFADDSSNGSIDSSASPTGSEEIEVTGSHIRRVDTEGVAPVETVTHEDMAKEGYNTLGDVVRNLGVNTFGSGTPSGNSETPGNADIGLRGLGSDNTLVLLNGQRLPQDPISGTVDINLIPMAAVERIEILKDGASAIYGSDALAGVVNIITRKDFQGTEFSATQTIPTQYPDGKQTDLSFVNGINTEKLSIVTSANFRYSQPVYSKNRPWSNSTNFSAESPTGNPASFSPNSGAQQGNQFASTACPASSVSNGFCYYKFSDFSEEMPESTQVGVMSEAHYELNSDIRLFSRLSFVHRDSQTVAAAPPSNFTIPAADVNGSMQSFFPAGSWAPGEDITAYLRLTPLGTRNNDYSTNSYGIVSGGTIQLPHDWQMDMTPTFNLVRSTNTGTSGYALTSAVQTLVNNGTFNPFAPVGFQGALPGVGYTPVEQTDTLLTGFEVSANGELFSLPAGPVSMAVGTLFNFSSYYDNNDPQIVAGNVYGDNGSSGAGHRAAEAVYSELSIPLITKKLEMKIAGRFDHYSDFGSTVNPMAGLLYHASPSLLLRGSVGTGFRAPLLSEMYAGQSSGFPSFIDYFGCAKNPGSAACSAQQYQVTSGGNPNLKQETSVSYAVGAVYSPTTNFNIATDWYYTRIANEPGIDYNQMTQAELNGVNLANYGVIVTRDPSTQQILSVVAPLQNLEGVDEFGVDITGSYSYKKWKLQTEQNQIFFYKTEGFPGAGFQNELGWYGQPSWRNATQLSYDPAPNHSISLTSHSIPSQKTLDRSGYITPLTTFDISYTYRTKQYGDFSIGMINIAGSGPPYDISQPQSPVNYSLYDPNGRQVVIGYRKAL